MSYYYNIGGKLTSVWALYLYESGPRVAVCLGSVSKTSTAAAIALLKRLKAQPELATALAGIEEWSLNRFPQVPVESVLVGAEAENAFFAALNELADPSKVAS